MATVEKTEQQLRHELETLQRQQREITERIRDPRGIRRLSGGGSGGGGGGVGGGGSRGGFGNPNFIPLRSATRPGDGGSLKDERPAKRRLSSAVVKMDGGEVDEGAHRDDEIQDEPADKAFVSRSRIDASSNDFSSSGRIGGHQSENGQDYQVKEVPRVLPKNEDPRLVNRNKRMLNNLLGTLEKFKKEDMKLSGTEAYMRRSDSLQRAEQKAREDSERLRQQERERIAENRKRDLVLRARVAAKAEEKKLELLFLRWSEHHKRLSSFLRTKAEPPIYYVPAKPLEEDAESSEKMKEQAFLEWKAARKEELAAYYQQIQEEYITNVEKDLERRLTARKARKGDDDANLQETMDKELETHRLEHGPKARKIPGADNEDEEEEVEDINVAEDDMMDDVLGLDENDRVEQSKHEISNTDPLPKAIE